MAFNADALMKQRLLGMGGAKPPGISNMSMAGLSLGKNLNRLPRLRIPFGPRISGHICLSLKARRTSVRI